MALGNAQQRLRRTGGSASTLLPVLKRTGADSEERREGRLAQAHPFADGLNALGQFHFVAPALAVLDGTDAFKDFLSDVTLFGHGSISFRSARNTWSGMSSASFLA